jgi:hypothetical protein
MSIRAGPARLEPKPRTYNRHAPDALFREFGAVVRNVRTGPSGIVAALLTAEDVVRQIAAECSYVDEQGGVGIRLRPAAAIVRQYGDQYRLARPAAPARRPVRRPAKAPKLL